MGKSGQQLSPRQEQIVVCIALGKTDKEIAIQLGISERTVRTHLERLFRSIGVHNRAGAVAVCLSRGDLRGPLSALYDAQR
jgi:DNA-binding CsgD family transcriptional regulator